MENDPLAALQPLHLPPDISWWPPAPGWWLLLLLLFLLLRLWWQRRRRHQPQRAALRQLRQLQQSGQPPAEKVATLNLLLKRYLITSRPNQSEAALSGEAWLRFLDQQSPARGFLEQSGQLLLSTPYRPTSPHSPLSREVGR